ncbi:TPA: GGDEF domain-containing protein [Photobacterium damselae]
MKIHNDTSALWRLVDMALSIVRPLGVVAIIFGLISIAGYFGSVETLYRPIENGSATNPLTAVTIIFLGTALYKNLKIKLDIIIQQIFAFAALTIASIRLVDSLFGLELSQFITPFYQQVMSEIELGKSNSMGLNTALMLFSIAGVIVFYSFKQYFVSQLIATVSVSMPLISFLGYAYGLENFYGQMSMLTAISGFALSVAALSLTADKAFLNALLSPYIGGRVARFQVVAGYLVPIFLGYLLVKTIVTPQGSLFGVFVIGICWFIMIMVCISAIVVERVDNQRRIKEQKLLLAAMTDHLTGLPNRRMFFNSAEQEMSRVRRSNASVWILMLDIDKFKKINDVAGHAIGDKVLIEVSNTLKSSLREVDIIGRLGGEEFAIILSDTPMEGAQRVAENIRLNIEKTEVEGWTNSHGPITISIGCAKADSGKTFDDALAKADEALYQAKESGRNQVCFYSS